MSKIRYVLSRSYAFFGGKISNKYKTVCCKYGLQGKPFSKEKGELYLSSLREYLEGWELNEDSSELRTSYYMQDYRDGLRFIQEVNRIDELTGQQKPSFSVESPDLLRLGLRSNELKGVSQADFDLAMRINHIDLDEYGLIRVKGGKGYRREARMEIKRREEMHIQNKLRASFGSLKGDIN